MQPFSRFETPVPSGPRLIESAVERNAMVVAMERGTRWPSWIESFRKHAPNVVVIVQQPEEPLERFAERIEFRKAILRGEPFLVMTAILLAARSRGAARGRMRVAASLIQALDLARDVVEERRLVLGTSEPHDPRSASALLRLAERLSQVSSNTGLTISTRLWSEPFKTPVGVSR